MFTKPIKVSTTLVGLSPSKKKFLFVCFNDSPSKMMKNDFYFILKVFSFSRYLNFYLDFWACKKNRLIRKVNYEIYDVTVWLTKNYNTHIAQYLMN